MDNKDILIMKNNPKFVLRTFCETFNHENYIQDALKGFVMQQTTFPVVYTIVDDASTDNTPDVIKRFVSDFFELGDTLVGYDKDMDYGHITFARNKTNENCFFAVIYLKENHYSQRKSKTPYLTEWMDTKYIALCEGDDYWTDPLKLQKQVDILETDKTLMAVVANSKLVDKDGNELKAKQDNIVPDNKQGRYDLRSFMYKVHHYPTATVCYRRTHVEEIEKMTRHMSNPYLGDWTLWIALHVFGDFYYLDQVTSAYRINPTSVTHTCDRVGRSKANWTICKAVQDVLPSEYDDIRKSLNEKSWMWRDLAMAYRYEHRYFRMFWCFFVAFVKNPKGLVDEIKKRKSKKN